MRDWRLPKGRERNTIGGQSLESSYIMTERKYSSDEVDAILGRALERERQQGGLSHDDLLAAAREVGISAGAIEAAATEVLAERQEHEELARMRQDQWRGFLAHLIPYLLVNGLLVTVNLLTTHFPWSLFPALGWGVGLASHAFAVLWPSRGHLERKLERRRAREQRTAIRRQIRRNARRLEHHVEQGVSAVLQAAAERISLNSHVEAPDAAPRAPAVEPGETQGAPAQRDSAEGRLPDLHARR
jgi:2TM domain